MLRVLIVDDAKIMRMSIKNMVTIQHPIISGR